MNAGRDQNSTPSLIAALNTDGVTIIQVQADPSTHHLQTDDNTTGSDHGTVNALVDESGIRSLMAVSSVDGHTPVTVYVTSSGQLLTDSN